MSPCETSMGRTGRAVAVLALLLLVGAEGCASSRPARAPVVAPRDKLAERWGVEVLGLRRVASGYLLDFRYRVVDPEKAARLFERGARPYVLEPSTGARFLVPRPAKVGSLRQVPAEPESNRTYFILFANPGRALAPGSRVTVVIGDFQVDGVEVE
ncbi:hypothetical protein [Myxococcus sp. RHSTA-1-4]|uniref:hypothetical protein n=1 Tax=Myxococcus sp. RHSTA-1-4 TaxID=2874601 RepID=UPI001CBE1354|nr:hypothetical protein [Myxococcus sp. RHSTA-1-4]MBZ4420663.1 hypothetical protein [Myxococcus sp. RHSTA-1-4]